MILYILNLMDMVTTLLALSLGAVEMNPIMAFSLSINPILFVIIKLAALPLCLWLERKSKVYPYLVGAFAVTVGWNIAVICTMI